MDRRRFLGQAAALLTGPLWIRKAFAGDDCEGEPKPRKQGPVQVATAYRRAQRAGKPLLVLVVPKNNSEKYERGHLFGSYLNYATEAQLAPIALAEVVCAKMKDLRAIVPVAPAGEPALVLIETDAVPATATPYAMSDLKLPLAGRFAEYGEEEIDRAEIHKRELETADQRIACVAALVRAILGEELSRRVEQASRRLAPGAATRAIAEIAAGRALEAKDADAAAAHLLRAAEGASPGARDAYLHALAAAAAHRLRDQPPRGARWALSGGCGVEIEGDDGDDRFAMACGMGHVPPKSERFLFLFSRGADYWREREEDDAE